MDKEKEKEKDRNTGWVGGEGEVPTRPMSAESKSGLRDEPRTVISRRDLRNTMGGRAGGGTGTATGMSREGWVGTGTAGERTAGAEFSASFTSGSTSAKDFRHGSPARVNLLAPETVRAISTLIYSSVVTWNLLLLIIFLSTRCRRLRTRTSFLRGLETDRTRHPRHHLTRLDRYHLSVSRWVKDSVGTKEGEGTRKLSGRTERKENRLSEVGIERRIEEIAEMSVTKVYRKRKKKRSKEEEEKFDRNIS